jgi:hypothetical protein
MNTQESPEDNEVRAGNALMVLAPLIGFPAAFVLWPISAVLSIGAAVIGVLGIGAFAARLIIGKGVGPKK